MIHEKLKGIIPPYPELPHKIGQEMTKFFNFLDEGTLKAFHIKINQKNIVKGLKLNAQNIPNLESLSVFLCQIPESFPDLEILTIYLEQLTSLPKDFSKLKFIKEFELKCRDLTLIPSNLFDNMQSLRHLVIGSSLQLLNNQQFFLIPQLERLVIEVDGLKQLPSSIGKLHKLNLFSLCGHVEFTTLPEFIGDLVHLKQFYMEKTNVRFLPSSIGNLKNLIQLTLEKTDLENLPESLSECKNLEKIFIDKAPNLRTLPVNLGRLQHLKEIRINNCPQLQSIPESILNIPHLDNLVFVCCPKLTASKEFQIQLQQTSKIDFIRIDQCGPGWIFSSKYS